MKKCLRHLTSLVVGSRRVAFRLEKIMSEFIIGCHIGNACLRFDGIIKIDESGHLPSTLIS